MGIIRYALGWVLVLIGLGLAHLAGWITRAGAWLWDREDEFKEEMK